MLDFCHHCDAMDYILIPRWRVTSVFFRFLWEIRHVIKNLITDIIVTSKVFIDKKMKAYCHINFNFVRFLQLDFLP